MAVRSRRLFGPAVVLLGSTFTTLYTVPAGRTAVFRTLTITNSAVAVANCLLFVGDPLSVVGATWFDELPATSTVLLEDLVANPGDAVIAYSTTAAAISCAGYGSLLLGAPA